MERLTDHENEHYNQPGCNSCSDYMWRSCKESGEIDDCIQRLTWLRLLDIEDILGDDYDLDRLRELVKADREGRCVLLPCKVGDKIYTTHRCKDGRNFITEATVVGMHIKDEFCRGYIPRKEYVVCRCNGYSKHIPMDHIGKRAFFSFKAAEAALKGEQA